MSLEKNGDSTVSTENIALAASISTLTGQKPAACEKVREPGISRFYFADLEPNKFAELRESFNNNDLKVAPQEFMRNLKSLKKMANEHAAR